MARNAKIVHKAMSSVKSENTTPEIILRKALWKKHCRYRINCRDILGKPDIVIRKYNIVVFVDGDYWHGHNWALRGKKSLEEELEAYSPYWQSKIRRNVERDFDTTIRLRDDGWTVLRFWGSDIQNDVGLCVDAIISAIQRNRQKSVKEKSN